MKLEAPRFVRSNPCGWAFKIQEYFDFHATVDENRLKIVALHLDEETLKWYKWMKAKNLFTIWSDFLKKMKKRFGPFQFEDFQSRLIKLVQKTTLVDYQSQFETLSNKVIGVLEAQLLSCFVRGLKPHLGREVRLSKPDTLL